MCLHILGMPSLFHSLQYITSLDIQTIWVQMHTTQSKPTSDLQPLSLFTWSLQCFQREEELTQKGKTIIIGVFQSMQQNQLENNFQNMKNIKRQPRIYILQQLSASLLPFPFPFLPPMMLQQLLLTAQGKRSPLIQLKLTPLTVSPALLSSNMENCISPPL